MKGQIKGWNEGDTTFLHPFTTFLTIDNNNDNKKKREEEALLRFKLYVSFSPFQR